MPSATGLLDELLMMLLGAGPPGYAQAFVGARKTIGALQDIAKLLGQSGIQAGQRRKLLEGLQGLTQRGAPDFTGFVGESVGATQSLFPNVGRRASIGGDGMGPGRTVVGGGAGGVPPGDASGGAAGSGDEGGAGGGISGAIQMRRVQSSNVYAIGYDQQTGTLRVQYLGGGGLATKEARNRARTKPGPVYDYRAVPGRLWQSFQGAASKGKWVWDNLRIRGTVAGHRFDYTLISGTLVGMQQRRGKMVPRIYVPRLAQGRLIAGGAKVSTSYVKRRIVIDGRSVKSVLPREHVTVHELGRWKRHQFIRGR